MADRLEVELCVRVPADRREEFLAFLAEAIPFYESPGDIRVRLLESASEPNAFVERIEYATREAFELDQERVERDPKMLEFLARWRALLDRPPVVRVLKEVPVSGGGASR